MNHVRALIGNAVVTSPTAAGVTRRKKVRFPINATLFNEVINLRDNGLNAATGEYEDLVKLGVIDAAKVTRSALQNAASIAALFLTTEVVIDDKPDDGGGAMPGGGMDDF